MAMSFPRCAMLRPQSPSLVTPKSLQSVKELVKSVGIPSILTPPHLSLQRGNWVKLICGASFEDVVDVRNLSLVYTLAGVDCIDCAADESVVCAVNEGIEAAICIIPVRRPWVMISVNDDQDIHFRKAEFDPEDCPLDCLRPCEKVCPANAIFQKGVITERCYGCGRCSPVCPYDKIGMVAHLRDAASTSELLNRKDVDAIEIHTAARQIDSFEHLWKNLGASVSNLRLVAVRFNLVPLKFGKKIINPKKTLVSWKYVDDLTQISLPNIGDSVTSVMNTMFEIMRPNLHSYNLWQLDGRPMSGDTGRGATRKAISFAVHLVSAQDKPPGFLQLAGGTNAHTINGLKKEGIFQTSFESGTEDERTSAVISGVAFGGYARKIVGRILRSVESEQGVINIESRPEYLKEAVREALDLVGTVKCYNNHLD